MIYTIVGLQSLLIKENINKIKEKYNFNQEDITQYSLLDTKIDDVLIDCLSLSMFNDKKLIIVNDAYIFTGTIKKGGLEHDISELEKYLNFDNQDCILIFIVESEKLDERKKIVKLLKSKSKLIEVNSINLVNVVKEQLKDYKIENNLVNYLINRTNNNLEILFNEIEKLKIYKDENLLITKDDIDNIVTKMVSVDFFKFIENIILKNKLEAMETYYELMKLNEEPIKIIVMLSNQIRLMYQVKYFMSQGYSEKDIAIELGAHPYSIKLANIKSKKYTNNELLNNLNKLANLDIEIKSGKINKELALELFIINL